MATQLHRTVADEEFLPLRPGSMDGDLQPPHRFQSRLIQAVFNVFPTCLCRRAVIISCLGLHWVNDVPVSCQPPQSLQERASIQALAVQRLQSR